MLTCRLDLQKISAEKIKQNITSSYSSVVTFAESNSVSSSTVYNLLKGDPIQEQLFDKILNCLSINPREVEFSGDSILSNLFTDQNMITHGQYYKGTVFFDKCLNRLRSGQGLQVIGESGVGKSSLLYHFYKNTDSILPGLQYKAIFIDMNLYSSTEDIDHAIKTQAEITDVRQNFCQALMDSKKKYVICIDRVGRLAHSSFDPMIQSWLRGLCEQPNIILVTANEQPLGNVFTEVTHFRGDRQSPIVGHAEEYILKSWTLEEITSFIRSFGERTKLFTEEHLSNIFDLSGGLQRLVQYEAHKLYDSFASREREAENS
jgi:hypothetical protein